MSLTFYFVRHGQTLFNLMLRIQGSCDSPLTDKGIEDARRAGRALKDVEFAHAYCSSSERAIDTAGYILEGHPLQAEPMKGLKEFAYGQLDGCTIPECREELESRRREHDYSDIGGDNRPMMFARIQSSLDHMIEQSKDGDQILIVSHGNFCLFLMEYLFGIDQIEFRKSREGRKGFCVPNGGILKFEYDQGSYRLLNLPMDPDEYLEMIRK